MGNGFFITGTDTDAGKTVVTAQLLRGLVATGKKAVGMKPVASGCEWRGDVLWSHDVAMHAAASNVAAPESLTSPYRFLPAISPHLAAREVGVNVELALLQQRYQALQELADVVLVEGAGGWLAPLTDELTMADLARAFDLPVLLVVGMRLGCINHAMLSVRAIEASGCRLAGWVANRIDPVMSHYADNLRYLQGAITAPLIGEVLYSPDAGSGFLALHAEFFGKP